MTARKIKSVETEIEAPLPSDLPESTGTVEEVATVLDLPVDSLPVVEPLNEDDNEPASDNALVEASPAALIPLEMTDKRMNFRRVGAARTDKALECLRLIGNLASVNYEHTPEEVERMFGALLNALQDAHDKLTGKTDRKFAF